jgi:HAD superfamily hydrolase (TIGR01509 family)
MSKFKAIFFDNDGLLVDTESLYYEATKEILDTIGIDIPLDWYKRALEVGNSAFKFAEARGVSQEETERLRAVRNTRYNEMLSGLKPIDGVVDILKQLQGKVFMAIVTNSRKTHFETIMRETGLRQYFDYCVTTNEVPRPKPYPDPYLFALEQTHQEASHSLSVEDSGRGVTSAKAAGLTCYAIPDALTRSHDFSKADKILSSIRELPELVL